MDITVDGFHSWMWKGKQSIVQSIDGVHPLKGLGFLLPFLYIGYIYEMYNAYKLYQISQMEGSPWQVFCLSLVFALISLGNAITTSWTIPSKIGERQKGLLKMRFTRLDKYFWSHRRRRNSVRQTNKKYSKDMQEILDRMESLKGDREKDEEEEESSAGEDGQQEVQPKRDKKDD